MANAQRKQQILGAALELFAERGYFGTSMQDIAHAVGIRASSLYNHVSSKEQVLAELCVGWMGQLLVTFDAAMAGESPDPVRRLDRAVRTHLRFHAQHALAVRVVNHEFTALEPKNRAQVVNLRRDYVVRWKEIVLSGVESGVFRVPDPKIAVYALIDMGLSVSQWFDPKGTYDTAQLGEMYTGFALGLVGAADL